MSVAVILDELSETTANDIRRSSRAFGNVQVRRARSEMSV